MGQTIRSRHRDFGLYFTRMFLFVLAVWLWNAWLTMLALKAYPIWHSQKEDSLLFPPVDVDKVD